MGMKYFCDLNGETIELTQISSMKNADFKARWPDVKGYRYDGYYMFVGYIDRVAYPITRKVNFKSFPSRHECDARCMNATGRNMNCECRCGGKNHGKGFCISS